MFIPSTKKALVEEIYKNTHYTKKEIEEKYKHEVNKNPARAKYYAKKQGIKVLQGWLKNIKQNNL